MSRISVLVSCQAVLCFVATYLVSKISLIGRVGIALFYKEYRIFRSGWKTFLLFFGIQLAVILVLYMVQKKYSRKTVLQITVACLLLAVAGLLATFIDFQYTYSHRLLKERFHLGFYLFWLGWIGTCIFFLVTTVHQKPGETALWPKDENAPATTD